MMFSYIKANRTIGIPPHTFLLNRLFFGDHYHVYFYASIIIRISHIVYQAVSTKFADCMAMPKSSIYNK